MIEYTVYCTEEQTNLAYKLGAPIKFERNELSRYLPVVPLKPTTQQMISWLEEKGQIIEVCRLNNNSNLWSVFINNTQVVGKYFECRYEAEIYAIDAALDYLEKVK